jgi:4-hydroxyphenylpyruvate dioxygenase-like putative hemolysin
MSEKLNDSKESTSAIIDHIAIAVTNLEAAIKWYCEGLGLSVLERRVTAGVSTGMTSAVLTGAGIPIVLIQGTEPESQVSRFVNTCGAGVQHIAFAVSSLESGLAKLDSMGTRPAFPIIEGDGIRQVFMESNNHGARIELIERNGGSFNDQSVQQLFLEFESRDLY